MGFFDIYSENRNDQRKYYLKDGGGGGGHERLLKDTENERPDEVAKHGNEMSGCMKWLKIDVY